LTEHIAGTDQAAGCGTYGPAESQSGKQYLEGIPLLRDLGWIGLLNTRVAAFDDRQGAMAARVTL
jgi:hypothetical protein